MIDLEFSECMSMGMNPIVLVWIDSEFSECMSMGSNMQIEILG
jgi:hypothetical protein